MHEQRSFSTDRSEATNQSIFLSDLANGDHGWEHRVLVLSMDRNEPLILPGWNLGPCKEFYNKAVSYGEGGGRFLPPDPIFNRVHPVGAATVPAVQQMQLDIMTYFAVRGDRPTTGAPSVVAGANGSVGLACTWIQYAGALMQMKSLEHDVDWFKAVLEHGEPLSGPLATLYKPRPRVGICEPLRAASPFWT